MLEKKKHYDSLLSELPEEEGGTEASSLLDESTQTNSLVLHQESKYSDKSYFLTIDPMHDEVFTMRDVRDEHYAQKQNSQEFEMNLHDSVRGIKAIFASLMAQVRTAGPRDQKAQDSIYQTKLKLNDLINDLQGSLEHTNDQFKAEAAECYAELNMHK